MTSEELIPRIQFVFDRVFGGSVSFDPSLARIDEAQWTSLRHVELIIALEQELGIRFDGADATDMTSIPIITDRCRQRLR